MNHSVDNLFLHQQENQHSGIIMRNVPAAVAPARLTAAEATPPAMVCIASGRVRSTAWK